MKHTAAQVIQLLLALLLGVGSLVVLVLPAGGVATCSTSITCTSNTGASVTSTSSNMTVTTSNIGAVTSDNNTCDISTVTSDISTVSRFITSDTTKINKATTAITVFKSRFLGRFMDYTQFLQFLKSRKFRIDRLKSRKFGLNHGFW